MGVGDDGGRGKGEGLKCKPILESMAWKVSPGFLTQARFLGDALALSSFPEKSWGEERARCSKPACGRPGRWRGGVGYFSRKGGPGSSPRLKRRGLAGVGCGERGGRRRDSPRAGKSWRKDSAVHPDRPFWKLQPHARTALPQERGGGKGRQSGKTAGGKRGGREYLLPAAAPDVSAAHSAPPAPSAPRLTSQWRRARAEAAPSPAQARGAERGFAPTEFRGRRPGDRKAAKREEKGGKGGVGGDIFKDYKKAARAAPFLHSLESGSEPGAFA